eukprot:3320902-Rhodomonas_salina.1
MTRGYTTRTQRPLNSQVRGRYAPTTYPHHQCIITWFSRLTACENDVRLNPHKQLYDGMFFSWRSFLLFRYSGDMVVPDRSAAMI